MSDKTVPAWLLEIDADVDAWRFDPRAGWNDGAWIREGECADGVGDLRIYKMVLGWRVEYECGRYEQAGDADDEQGVVVLVDAMGAATKALEATLTALESDS